MSESGDMTGNNSPRVSIISSIIFFMFRYICLVNMGVSIAYVAIGRVSHPLEKSGIIDDPNSLLIFSYYWYGITIFVSFIALLTDAGILFLCWWDLARFVFITMCLIPSRADSKIDPFDRLALYLYLVWLMISILIELYKYCLTECSGSEYMSSVHAAESDINSILNRHFTPLAATTTVSEECELQNPLSRVFTRFRRDSPPSYYSLFDSEPLSDAELPSYSSLKLSSASTLGRPAATSFLNVPGRPVRATFSTVDFPPPYEYQVGSGNAPIFCTSREELQQPTNPDVSTHM